MTDEVTGGAGHKVGRTSFGVRRRAQRLYRSRRGRLLEVPAACLCSYFGEGPVEVDEEDARFARVLVRPDLVVEVGFAGVYRMFGALIDTQWVARRGDKLAPSRVVLDYRFDKMAFVSKGAGGGDIAVRINDEKTRRLARAGELKRLRVLDDGVGRQVEIIPLPGTITAMYLPPLPPYTVPIKPEEAAAQLDLLLHLVDHT